MFSEDGRDRTRSGGPVGPADRRPAGALQGVDDLRSFLRPTALIWGLLPDWTRTSNPAIQDQPGRESRLFANHLDDQQKPRSEPLVVDGLAWSLPTVRGR